MVLIDVGLPPPISLSGEYARTGEGFRDEGLLTFRYPLLAIR